jgi:SAM-dependent methyltransferase
VVGLDFSHAFVAAADRLKTEKTAKYTCTEEGELQGEYEVCLPATSRPDRVHFLQGDACALPSLEALGLPAGQRFSVIHGANLLCRLPDPLLFLRRLPSLLVEGGLVVFVSPYSWLKQYTPKENWLGGKYGNGTNAASAAPSCQWSRDGLTRAMAGLGFELIHEEEVPFLIREHRRKFQWGCSHATIWKLTAPATN